MTKEIRELGVDQLESVSGGGSLDGISYLVAVTQMKASNANEGAMVQQQAHGQLSGNSPPAEALIFTFGSVILGGLPSDAQSRVRQTNAPSVPTVP